MRPFNAREIELCRELAGLWRMPLNTGDICLNENGDQALCIGTAPLGIPLPRLDDVLAEIRRRGWNLSDHVDDGDKSTVMRFDVDDDYIMARGATDLEAALQCLIEIIRKGEVT